MYIWVHVCVPHGSDSKESTCKAGDRGLTPELGRSPGGGLATHSSPAVLPGESPWTEGFYSPWGHKVGQE